MRSLHANRSEGPLARVGLNVAVNANPESVVKILQPRSGFIRALDYQAARFRPGSDNILSMRDEKAHKTLKLKTTAGYNGKDVEGLEGQIDRVVESFVDLIERKYLSTPSDYRTVDLARITQYFTLDVIMSVAFGKNFGHLESDSDVYRYLSMTESFMPVVAIVLVYPWLCNVLESKFLKMMAPKDTDKQGMGKVMGFAKEVVSERFGPNRIVRKDMLGSFIAHGMTQEEANSETLVQIVAGSDTTATAIRAIFLHVISSPHIYSTLRKEIDNAGPISSPITKAEAENLFYLQAVIEEGLRFWPPIGLLASKLVPNGGATINGFFMPEGSNIGVSIMGIQRSKDIFGEDADEFRPERWLNIGEGEAEKAREKKMRGTVDLVFASGKYSCPGRQVAMMELNKIFVEVLRKYDITLVNPSQPWTSFYAGVWMQKNLRVRFSKRTDSVIA
ncbi:cytochrome P450 [Aspergillus clavatus NRRL 1]|uniref:Benzoate 4-monooxygenase cytochrome P450 n=1 Tax=Aspergillus clavatus (strain ATCC 1007 / CBS 513.65 / DSM 816 / NCTC 3887 / NRRL 1 / QM 1276 / 107) TaxID=344612 RepID=A1CCB8_ASPCL|nr:benzoate 4-monooxygenase cytochrome P450 [Aspergillus clavatus NRRL 1]EAW12175.1 benzoate 4-monooxygenase cytochrome P450 [Aspergillus clavatus NRRL 1]